MMNLYIALTVGILIGYSISIMVNEPVTHDELVLDYEYNAAKHMFEKNK